MVFLLFGDVNDLCGVFSTREKAEEEIVRSYKDGGTEFYSLEEWKKFFTIKKMPIDKAKTIVMQ